MKKSFIELYNELNLKYGDKIQEQQKKQKKITYIQIAIYIVLFLFMVLSKLYMFIPFVSIFYIVICVIITGLISGKSTGGTGYYKENVINGLVTNIFENANYLHNSGITRSKYNNRAFSDHFDRYRSEDLVITHNENNLTFSEVHTEDESEDEEGRKSYTTSFWGIYGYCDISRELPTDIYITSNKLFGGLNKNKIDMDMPEFEKKYDVYADDKIIAVQLLTADVMTELMDLKDALGCMFEIVIENNVIYFRLHTGNSFEMAVFKNSMSVEILNKYYNILEHVEKITNMINKNIKELNI